MVVGRPAEGRDLGFDRIELAISQRTGVPLRTVYYQGEKEIRSLTTAAADVKEFDGRFLPTRRTVRTADGTVAQVLLRQHDTEREVKRRVFTRQSLKTQRFPKFKAAVGAR